MRREAQLVAFVCSVYLVYLVEPDQPDKPDEPDRPRTTTTERGGRLAGLRLSLCSLVPDRRISLRVKAGQYGNRIAFSHIKDAAGKSAQERPSDIAENHRMAFMETLNNCKARIKGPEKRFSQFKTAFTVPGECLEHVGFSFTPEANPDRQPFLSR